jgi:hypothetical protein
MTRIELTDNTARRGIGDEPLLKRLNIDLGFGRDAARD